MNLKTVGGGRFHHSLLVKALRAELIASTQHDIQNPIDQLPEWWAEKFDGVPPVLCVDPFGMGETLEAYDTVIRVDPARPNATKRQIILRHMHYGAAYHHLA